MQCQAEYGSISAEGRTKVFCEKFLDLGRDYLTAFLLIVFLNALKLKAEYKSGIFIIYFVLKYTVFFI
jgi:hypothetical protein